MPLVPELTLCVILCLLLFLILIYLGIKDVLRSRKEVNERYQELIEKDKEFYEKHLKSLNELYEKIRNTSVNKEED